MCYVRRVIRLCDHPTLVLWYFAMFSSIVRQGVEVIARPQISISCMAWLKYELHTPPYQTSLRILPSIRLIALHAQVYLDDRASIAS